MMPPPQLQSTDQPSARHVPATAAARAHPTNRPATTATAEEEEEEDDDGDLQIDFGADQHGAAPPKHTWERMVGARSGTRAPSAGESGAKTGARAAASFFGLGHGGAVLGGDETAEVEMLQRHVADVAAGRGRPS